MESTPTEDVNSENKSGMKFNDLCNMSWLKNNSKSLSDFQESSEVSETGKNQKTGKKRKQKKLKSVPTASESKDPNAKTSDTDTEQKSKSKGRRKPQVLPITAITVSNPPTVWNTSSAAASTLFPKTQTQPVDEFEETIQLSKVLEESIVTAELEKFRLTPDKDKINWADDSEEPGWGAVGKNLPEPSQNTNIPECEMKIGKKSPDDNNNRKNKWSIEQEVNKIDKFGRIDGRTERHLFQGRGARMREEHFINQHTDRKARISTADHYVDRNRDQRIFHDRNTDAFSNRNRGFNDFDETSSNSYDHRNRGQRDIGERNLRDDRCSNFDDKREYRNKSFPTSNQRDNYQRDNHQRDNHQRDNYQRDNRPRENQSHQRDNRYCRDNHQRDNHQRDGQFHHRDNQYYQRDNHRQRYSHYQRNEDHSMEGNPRRFGNHSQKYDNQHQRHDNQHSESRHRQYPNEDKTVDSSLEKEFENLGKTQQDNEQSTPELEYNESSTFEKIDSAKENIEEPNAMIERNSCTSTSPVDDEISSLVFMQESCNDDSDSDNPLMNDHASETTSEKSEDTPTASGNPYPVNVPSMPFHVLHQPGIPNEMGFKVVSNPFMTAVPVSSTSQMLPSESGCSAPVQNLDMRFFPQHPLNIVHNHPGNPYLPIVNYPMGMPIHSCGQMPAHVPVGNVQGMNLMHQQQQAVNCHQCPSHYCHSPRMPMPSVNCQSSMYPAQFVTPITTVPLPMAPISPNQIQSMRHPFSAKVPTDRIETPVTEIGKSVSNLVSLCESIPSRRTGLSNCPPGFENTDYAKAMQKRIIYNKEQELPTFRNNSRVVAQEQSRKSPKKTEQFTFEKINSMYEVIRCNQKNNLLKEGEGEPLHQDAHIKFAEGSYNQQLFKTFGDSEHKADKTSRIPNTQAPRPGFRIGLGRGRKLGPTT